MAEQLCPRHGPHESLVCVPCYSLQQERVERESALLREANTAPALRARVVAELSARQNGRVRV